MPTVSDMSDDERQLLDSLLGNDISEPEGSIPNEEVLSPSILNALQLEWEVEVPEVSPPPPPPPPPAAPSPPEEAPPPILDTPQVPEPQTAPVLTQDYGPCVTPLSWTSLARDLEVPTISEMLAPNVNALNVIPREVDTYLRQRLSFDDRQDNKTGLSLNQRLYVSLSRAIQETNGDVTDFCGAMNTLWSAWMRKRAAVFLSQVMYSTVSFPGLPAGGLASLDCSLRLSARHNVRIHPTPEGTIEWHTQLPTPDHLASCLYHYEFLLEVDPKLKLEGLPKEFVNRAYQYGMELQYIPIDLVYRFFFLDKALPYYAYLYQVDMNGGASALSVAEQNFLMHYSYYDFVACITFLGSLLLTAAKSFSQMLYEGVQLMLMRAYCALGVLRWSGEYGLNLQETPLHSFFTREFRPIDRLCLSDCPGDAYAQQGWEIFKRRPSALSFLCKLTSEALFGASDINLAPIRGLLRKVDKALCARDPSHDPSLVEKDIGLLESVTSLYFDRGIIAIPTRGYRWVVSPTDNLYIAVRHVRESAFSRGLLYYEDYIVRNGSEPKCLREWFFLSDLLLLGMSEVHKTEILAERTRREKHVVGVYGQFPRNIATVSIPKPGEFGTKSYSPAVTGYKNKVISINVLQYLRTRLNTTINPNVITIFPTTVIRDMQRDSGVTCLKILQDMRMNGVGLMFARAQEADLSKQIKSLQNIIAAKDGDPDKGKNALLTLNTLLDARAEIQKAMSETLELACRYLVEGFKTFMQIKSLHEFLHPETNKEDFERLLSSGKVSELIDYQSEVLLFDFDTLSTTTNLMRYVDSQVFPLVTKKVRNTQREARDIRKSVLNFKDKEAEGIELAPEPKVKGRRPQLLYFALKRIDIDTHVLMIAGYLNNQLYVGFSDGISSVLADMQKKNTSAASTPKTLVAYPYEVFPFQDIVRFSPYIAVLSKHLDMNFLQSIRIRLLSEFPTHDYLRKFIAQDFRPDWLGELHGESTPTRALVELNQLLEVDKKIIARAHGLNHFSVKVWNKKAAEMQKKQLKTFKSYKKDVLRSLRDLTGLQRKRSYAPNFRPEEDAVIIEKYRAGMTETQRVALQIACNDRPWNAIRTRANILTHKLLDAGVYDLSKLPIRHLTKVYCKRAQDNLRLATMDGRINLEELGETLESLNEKYIVARSPEEKGSKLTYKEEGVDKMAHVQSSKELIRNLYTILEEARHDR